MFELDKFSWLFKNKLFPYLQSKACLFWEKQISLNYQKWTELTSDIEILQTVKDAKIEFVIDPPTQLSYPHNSVCKDNATSIAQAIRSQVDEKIITPCQHEPGEFNFTIF